MCPGHTAGSQWAPLLLLLLVFFLLSSQTGLFLHWWGKHRLWVLWANLRETKARAQMSHLYRPPSPQPSPQHQVERILILARGTLLCKGQEGVGGGHVEQGWDPVGDPSLVFLLEQRAVEGAWCHFFHDRCKDRRQLNVCSYPNAGLYTSSALSFHIKAAEDFWRGGNRRQRCTQMFIFLYKSNIMVSTAQSSQYTFSFNNLSSRLRGNLMQLVFKYVSPEILSMFLTSIQGYYQPRWFL